MPKREDPAKKYREPLVVLPYKPNERWHMQFQLRQMKRHGASDLALQVMQNEFERAANQMDKARAKRWAK